MNVSFLDPILDACKQNGPEHNICEEAACLHNLFYMKVAQWAELAEEFLAIICVILLVKTEQFRKLGAIVNPNLKVI